MARLTVTLDDALTRRLDESDVAAWKETLHSAMDAGAEELEPMLSQLLVYVDRFDGEPSASAVMRQALTYWFDVLGQAANAARMGAGYEALAQDEERAQVVERMSGRAPARWKDEP